jgi:hypothetical protein
LGSLIKLYNDFKTAFTADAPAASAAVTTATTALLASISTVADYAALKAKINTTFTVGDKLVAADPVACAATSAADLAAFTVLLKTPAAGTSADAIQTCSLRAALSLWVLHDLANGDGIRL